MPTPIAMARSWISAKSSSRRSTVRSFESATPRTRRAGSRMTAAATTAPANGPRPASSRPATRVTPVRQAWASYRHGADGGGVTPGRARLLGGGAGGDHVHTLLAQPRRLAGERAEIVELRAAHTSVTHHVDALDPRRVERERSLHADAVRDATHGKRGARALTPPPDHGAVEDLRPLLLAFDDPHVDPDLIAGV